MSKIKIIFIGTGEIGARLLKALCKNSNFDLSLVVTGTDKPAGRKMELQPSAIKKMALELGMEVFQPENIKTPESVEKLKSHSPDIILVMAYGQILSQEVLDLPKIDCLNVHASLLPKYRGASPLQSVILNGEKKTGISLMKMVKKMDEGAVYQKFEIPLLSEFETTGSLEEKISLLAAQKIPDALKEVSEGKIMATEQNETEATYVTKISKAEGLIDWTQSAEKIQRKICAFNPWPSAYTFFKGKRLKILNASVFYKRETAIEKASEENGWAGKGQTPSQRKLTAFESAENDALDEVGKVIEREGKIGVNTGHGILIINEVQLEGKKPQLMKEFLNGNTKFLGEILL